MSDTTAPLLNISEVRGVTVVALADRRIAGEEEIREFGKELLTLIEKDQRSRLVLSLQDVDSLPSGALAQLFKLKKRLCHAHGNLKLCNIGPQLLEVFSITRLNTLFEIYPDTAAAIASF